MEGHRQLPDERMKKLVVGGLVVMGVVGVVVVAVGAAAVVVVAVGVVGVVVVGVVGVVVMVGFFAVVVVAEVVVVGIVGVVGLAVGVGVDIAVAVVVVGIVVVVDFEDTENLFVGEGDLLGLFENVEKGGLVVEGKVEKEREKEKEKEFLGLTLTYPCSGQASRSQQLRVLVETVSHTDHNFEKGRHKGHERVEGNPLELHPLKLHLLLQGYRACCSSHSTSDHIG